MATADLPILLFKSTKAWAEWLDQHPDAPGLWVRLAKKTASLASITYAEALDVALCYGWIDSQKQTHDEHSWRQKFTPRGDRSIWSRVNREKAEAFIADGTMRPAGLRAVNRARQNGRWDAAYDSHSRATVPADLQAALDRNAKAMKFFATVSSNNRYAILFRIQTAVKPETRARRIQEFVAMLAKSETLHPQAPVSHGAAKRAARPTRPKQPKRK
ncbi:MAG TPA: YdeI/OmpD-associated family protein [Gemmatimonadaceae bacterium]